MKQTTDCMTYVNTEHDHDAGCIFIVIAYILVVAAGTACTAGPADRGLHASVSSPHAPEARQNARCRHPCLRRRGGPDPSLCLIRIVIKNEAVSATEAPRAIGGPASCAKLVLS